MENQEKTYDKKKKHLLIISGLILFNLITYNLFVKTGGYDASGQYVPYDQAKALKSSLITFFIGLPFISFFLGLLVAILPFRKLPYSKKYLRASLLTMLTINGLFSFGLICIMAMTAMGWYPNWRSAIADVPNTLVNKDMIDYTSMKMKEVGNLGKQKFQLASKPFCLVGKHPDFFGKLCRF